MTGRRRQTPAGWTWQQRRNYWRSYRYSRIMARRLSQGKRRADKDWKF
jgi:hypothetical protein